MIEYCKPVPLQDYKLHYLVSNIGNVISLRTGKTLKPVKSKAGYYRVSLSVNGKYKKVAVHRIVAMAFIPNPENKPTVNHINENKTDNRVENLEWATNKEQNAHGTRLMRAKEHTDYKARKINYQQVAAKHDYVALAKLNSKPIIQINLAGKFVKKFKSIREASKIIGISAGHICSCLKGKAKTAGGFKWQYAN